MLLDAIDVYDKEVQQLNDGFTSYCDGLEDEGQFWWQSHKFDAG